jgi:catalase-peroxidase
VELLHQNEPVSDPLGPDFEALKKDIKEFLTASQDWLPSDYDDYGPQMIRMT